MASDDAFVTGLNEILRKLEYLNAKGADKVLCAMVRAQLNVIAKQMRADLNPRFKAVRKTIKGRFKNQRKKNVVTAKVGFRVGSKKKSPPRAKRNSGIGIDENTIHWWVLGTDQRTTQKGADRGAMPPMQKRLAKLAEMRSRGKQRTEMVKRGEIRFLKELAVMQAMK